jgi:hypothetical protein
VRRGRGLLALAILVLALAGCQVKVQVDTKVNRDGSGTVTVAVGLDKEALAQVGDLKSQLQVNDLEAAGWTVNGPTPDGQGYTWVRASKPFADAAGARAVMDEVNGSDGAFRDWTVTRSSSRLSTTWKVTGTVDLSKGAQTFSDAKLDQALGASGYQDMISQIEKREGKPVSQMVDVQVSLEVPGASQTYHPTLADKSPTAVAVSHTDTTVPTGLLAAGAVVAILLVVVIVLLVRSRRKLPPARHAR